MNIESNHIYILKGNKPSNNRTVKKILVLELTEHTIFTQNLDSEGKIKVRDSLENFNYDWKAIEDLGLSGIQK